MKAKSTIRNEKAKLRAIIDNPETPLKVKVEAYAMETTLTWVQAESCDWTPATAVWIGNKGDK